MNKRVAIQAVTFTEDGQGGFTEEWATVLTVWASIETLKAYEKFQAMQMQSPVTHKLTMRYNSTITSAHRLIYDIYIYEIKEIININEDNTFLTIQTVQNLSSVSGYILREDGFYMLREDGGKFVRESI